MFSTEDFQFVKKLALETDTFHLHNSLKEKSWPPQLLPWVEVTIDFPGEIFLLVSWRGN